MARRAADAAAAATPAAATSLLQPEKPTSERVEKKESSNWGRWEMAQKKEGVSISKYVKLPLVAPSHLAQSDCKKDLRAAYAILPAI